jgi:hypothetical protein
MAKLDKTMTRAAQKAEANAEKAIAAAQKATALLLDPTRVAARQAFVLIQAARKRAAAAGD